MGLSRADSSSCLQLSFLREVAERNSPFAARLYLFFLLLSFKREKKKKNTAGKIITSKSIEIFLES